jgi:hypothetical protein
MLKTIALSIVEGCDGWLIAYGIWPMVRAICHKLSAICDSAARLASEIFLSSLQTDFFNNLLKAK